MGQNRIPSNKTFVKTVARRKTKGIRNQVNMQLRAATIGTIDYVENTGAELRTQDHGLQHDKNH